ncbi:MAG: molybdate ABC transporter substrate-binding protein [Deltaproteobacteria bacterium]|nr:molybdate ABC transporter substrate-binding protein [Deltaproteobacteria bacterium]
MSIRKVAHLFALAAVLLAPSARAADQELVVSAAASLTNAFGDLGKVFEKQNPGAKAVFNFAASGTLFQQIDKGAPADVFASADQETMDKAQAKGLLLAETRRNFVRNVLVLVVPADAKTAVAGPADLAKPEVKRIAVGDPAFVPVGRYTEQGLRAAGLLDVLKPKLIPANSVRQVLDYVSRGEVDAGLVYATDAAVAKDKVKVVKVVGGHEPILYPIAVVAASQRKDLARRFVALVASPEGQAVLARYGFGAP